MTHGGSGKGLEASPRTVESCARRDVVVHRRMCPQGVDVRGLQRFLESLAAVVWLSAQELTRRRPLRKAADEFLLRISGENTFVTHVGRFSEDLLFARYGTYACDYDGSATGTTAYFMMTVSKARCGAAGYPVGRRDWHLTGVHCDGGSLGEESAASLYVETSAPVTRGGPSGFSFSVRFGALDDWIHRTHFLDDSARSSLSFAFERVPTGCPW